MGHNREPEINPQTYDQLIYNKGAKNIQWERTVSSINSVAKIEEPHAKKKKKKRMKRNWIESFPYAIHRSQLKINGLNADLKP